MIVKLQNITLHLMLANLNAFTFVLKVTIEKYTDAHQYFVFVVELSQLTC